MTENRQQLVDDLYYHLTHIISETNGLSLEDTLDLLSSSHQLEDRDDLQKSVDNFRDLLAQFSIDKSDIDPLLDHPVSDALFLFFKNFPLFYNEEHIHLTGSLTAEFIFPRLKKLLEGPDGKIYEKRITDVYGKDAVPINSVEDIDKLIRLKKDEGFDEYLKILLLPKLILTDKEFFIR